MGDVFFLIVFLPHNRKTWIYVKNYSYRKPKGVLERQRRL